MRKFFTLLAMAAAALGACAFNPTPGECLDFLYAHMSVPDSLNRPRPFYERQVEATLEARRLMPWGEKVPRREWMHFVLPLRVNNEDLDESRAELFRQLAPRVKNLTMEEAALEVNHWCHERVTYRPSDARTLSPLACIKTAWGRCGEESTLAVAALRAVGIPARQVYTPRWAHTDDNHAWVEAWVDGKWHFLGACEPQPQLDMAWFNAPASRGMLMATNVHGLYDGPEEVLEQRRLNTRINVTDNYAPTDTLEVVVTDENGQPEEGAAVRMSLYNYAEFYPLASRVTGADGRARLTAGLGDLLVWAAKDGRFALRKCRVGEGKRPVTVVLPGDKSTPPDVLDFDLVPPRGSAVLPSPDAAAVKENDRRLACEDSLRHAYTATFDTPETAACFAREHGYAEGDMERLLPLAHGNKDVVRGFLADAADKARAVALLAALAPKDLGDVDSEVLEDCLGQTPEGDGETFSRYVLNPRVCNEGLTPCRALLRKAFEGYDADRLKAWVADSLDIDEGYEFNPAKTAISPEAVLRSRRHIDPASRDIFYVSAARAAGIPSRVDPVTGRVQVCPGGVWENVDFERAAATPVPQGVLRLVFDAASTPYTPKYYIHFTLARMADGLPVTLGFDEETPWTAFAEGVGVDAGEYVLVSGQRLADGTVLARCRFFEVPQGCDTVSVALEMRHDDTAAQVIGSFDSEGTYRDASAGGERSFLSANGRGYFVVALLAPNDEPSIHFLNDLCAAAADLSEMPEKIFLLYADDAALARAGLDNFPGLPANALAGAEAGARTSAAMRDGLGLDPGQTPLVVVADTFNRVVFASQGYSIGLGERLVSLMRGLK